MHRKTLAIALFFLMAGCAAQKSKETESLKSVESPRSIVLGEPLLKINNSKSWATVDVTQGLLPGTYISTVENSTGIFFYGNARCYFLHDVNSGKYYLRKGGFWVPKSPKESPRLFYIVDSQGGLVTAPSLESAIEEKTSNESVQSNSTPLMQPTNMIQGAGYGLGMGIVNAIAESEAGNIVIVPSESDNGFSAKLASIVSLSH